MSFKKIFFILASAFGLSSCEERTLSYYLRHPLIVSEKLNQCEEKMRVEQMDECALIIKAFAEIKPYVALAEMNPEKFGDSVLKAQMDLAAWQHEMSTPHFAPEKKQALQEKIAAKEHELMIMLGVLSLSAPS